MSRRLLFRLAACILTIAPVALAAQDADRVTVTGSLVDKNGAPLAGKTVCMLFQTADGKWFFPFDLSGGQLSAKTVKSDAQGQFTASVEWHQELKVGLCEGSGLAVKPVKSSTKAYPLPKGRKSVALGNVSFD